MDRMSIWNEIQQERKKQDAKWGGAAHDDKQRPNDWIAFIAYHVGKASYRADFRTQMIKVAALAVAAIEWVDRQCGRAEVPLNAGEVVGIVLAPDLAGRDGDAYPADAIRQAAEAFAAKNPARAAHLGSHVTESDQPGIPKGSWVVRFKPTPEEWEAIKRGDVISSLGSCTLQRADCGGEDMNALQAQLQGVADWFKKRTAPTVQDVSHRCKTRDINRDVREFCVAMGQEVSDRPRIPSDEVVRFRLRLVAEEFCELLDAAVADPEGASGIRAEVMGFIKERALRVDLPALIDACADIDYVVSGLRVAFGVDGAPIAALVHRANMAKLAGPVREDGKRLKPAGWKPPDVEDELRRQGWKKDAREVVCCLIEPGQGDGSGDTYTHEALKLAAATYKSVPAGCSLVSSFIEGDGGRTAGVLGVKSGTWVVVYRVDSDALWADLKSGKVTALNMGTMMSAVRTVT